MSNARPVPIVRLPDKALSVAHGIRALGFALIGLFMLVPASYSAQSGIRNSPVQHITYFQTGPRYQYRIRLLELALEKTRASHGSYRLAPASQTLTQARGLDLLSRKQGVNLAFLPTTAEREEDFLAIRIPILRGILGFRVFLIHRDKQPDFRRVMNLETLKKEFTAGFGSQWADMAILQANGLSLLGVAQYENLFAMLQYQRFDYFPRGLNEAWKEVAQKGPDYPGLIVEDSLALYYPYPVYFFVHQDDRELAQRLEEGLTLALHDGSFQALFIRHHHQEIERLRTHPRRLFILQNPTLPKDTPPIDTHWWLPPEIVISGQL